MIDASVAGLLTGLSLIIGCVVSGLGLIAAGVSGIDANVGHAGWIPTAVRWFGVAFLARHAGGSLRRARRAGALHVYLDTVLPWARSPTRTATAPRSWSGPGCGGRSTW